MRDAITATKTKNATISVPSSSSSGKLDVHNLQPLLILRSLGSAEGVTETKVVA
jgi:hypothetical protein